jgi:flagella basal body P-ring formation protein FlgA
MRDFIRLMAVALLAGAAFCAGAGSDEARPQIVLRESAVSSGDAIMLADVADLGDGVPAEARRLVLGNAPWPGHLREVSRALVKVKLVRAGFELSRFEFAGSDACLVEPATVRIEPEEIVAAARRHLEAHFAGGGPQVRIEPLHSVAAVLVPAGDGPVELRPALSSAGLPAGSVRVDVDVVRGAARLQRVSVTFSVQLFDQAAVASRAISPGQAFTHDNVAFVEKDVAAVGGSCVRSWADLEGKVALGPVRPGQVLTQRVIADPEAPLVIRQNQQVFLVVEMGAVKAVAVGKSLSRARRGEVARARNVSTGREVAGIAVDGATIQVFVEGASDGQ